MDHQRLGLNNECSVNSCRHLGRRANTTVDSLSQARGACAEGIYACLAFGWPIALGCPTEATGAGCMHLNVAIDEAPLLILDAAIALLGLLLAFALPNLGLKFCVPVERWAGRLARRRELAVLLVGISAPLIRLAMLPIAPIPQPAIHDEFSYLLAAETFASHRLTNPTPPLWIHFETFHEDFLPTYMSMYPPAQGLVLAAGTTLFRHPWLGVCLSVGAMCGAICWMLQGWFPPGWALYGSVLALLRLGVFTYWMNSYWGGAVAATGGALVLGALPRIMRRVRVRTALILGLGVAILANSRPFEGFVLSLAVAGALLLWAFGKKHPPTRTVWRHLALPLLVVLVATAAAMGYYNWRVFGNPATLPYQINRATYAVAPVFLWQSPRPEPVYHHKVLRDFYVKFELPVFQKARTVSGFFHILGTRILIVLFFFLGPALMLPLTTLPCILRDRRRRFLIVASAIFLAGMLASAFIQVHYLAPATALIFAIVVQTARRLRVWRPGGQPVGAFLVRALPCMCLALFLAQLGWKAASPTTDLPRTQVQHFLEGQPDRQLAIVRYGAGHDTRNEWVYNAADIDASRVIWARDMSAADNRELLDYYKDRQVWLVEPDQIPPRVSRYRDIESPDRPTVTAARTSEGKSANPRRLVLSSPTVLSR